MKKIINFLEKNNKWIVRIFIIVGLFFMIKLWSIGGELRCVGGGYIDICIFPTGIKYSWISASYIALIFFIFSIFLIKKIKKTENKIKKIQVSFLILFMGLIGKQFFFLVSPDFKFYMTYPTYKDKEGNITDLDKYLELTTKYCDNWKKGDTFNFIHPRETMCSGKFETDFETVEEYIKILEHAKKNDFRYLYQNTFKWIDENVGLKNVIEKYNDDTFYGYVMDSTFNLKVLESINKKIKDDILRKLLEYEMKKINYFNENDDILHHDLGRKYLDNLDKSIDEKLKEIQTINQNIF